MIPADHEVGNAVGAVTGMVEESIEMLVQPATGSRLSDPACTVFSKLGRFYIAFYSEGVDYAIRTGPTMSVNWPRELVHQMYG